MTVKLFFKDCLKPVCPALRSYHVKTVFYHFLEKTKLDVANEAELCVLIRSILKDLQECIKMRKCPHYFIPQVNLFDFPPETKTKGTDDELRICVEIINSFMNSNNMVRDVFSRNSRNEMVIRHFSSRGAGIKFLFLLMLVIVNIISLCLGAIVYIAGIFSVVGLLISFLYASLISFPIMAVFLLFCWLVRKRNVA